MYKCKSENCNYKVVDECFMNTFYLRKTKKCPICETGLEYINELQERINKYKKSMLLLEKGDNKK